MSNIKVLDVTLRDGGCVNDFNFGQSYMQKILSAQEASGVDIIELGYIDEIKGSASGRTQYMNEQVIPECILKHKKPGIMYVAMIDYGKFDVNKLQPKTPEGIDGIRVAFHKKDRFQVSSLGRKIMDKGYNFYIQPMITLRYSDAELLELIDVVNRELPDASGFYIVDTFGEMRPNDMNWIEVDDQTHDSSTVIAMKLLEFCGVTEVLLAGFDGFSSNINDNYYDPNMRRPVTIEQAERRNAYYRDFFSRVRQRGVNLEFITPSAYA